ncbi:PEP-CTERM protein-sorting domain-containing protein [Nitrosospira briensis]|nr:PEP-CTERM protein-sorting domain-containing protein [Nitrosospira briensis]
MGRLSVSKKRRVNKSAFSKSFFLFSRSRIKTAGLTLSTLFITSSFPFFIAQAHAQASYERLSSLLAATPEGGWVKASSNAFSDVWPTGADAVPISTQQFPGAIVKAWSSFAWDTTRGNLILWGGGHANYAGNEVYVWDGATGDWGRGSLPSRLENGFVVDSAAPQSSHTYDNNLYLPVNDMFLTLGGASWPTGGGFQKTDGTTITGTGPFLWDPIKADPNKVGGTTGSGWNTTDIAQGGNMWIDREVRNESHINGTSAHRIENGKDVVYFTAEQVASGFPTLYRYTLGDVRNGGQDTREKIGVTWNTVGDQSAGTLDNTHNLYIKTARVVGSYTSDLTIWDLDNANPINPNQNRDIGINLVNSDGSDFVMTSFYGLDYDEANNRIVLWDGKDGGGKVWYADVLTDEAGDIGSNTTWTIHEVDSSTAEHPHGSFFTGVLGKWHYDPSLGAFVALDEISSAGGNRWNADVWLYKPMAAVPEPQTYALLLAGLGLVGWAARRRRA